MGSTYIAQWWTQGQLPGQSSTGPWAQVGEAMACGDDTVTAWTPSWIYDNGDTAIHDGALWRARWWTRDQEPGLSEWGPWEHLSAC